jgi:hypothetical protein
MALSVVGVWALGASAVDAQWSYPGSYGGNTPYAQPGNPFGAASLSGYQHGYQHGAEDVNKRRSFKVDRDDDYEDADRGYNKNMGISKDDFKAAFRNAYVQGYSDGYYGRPRADASGYEGNRYGRRGARGGNYGYGNPGYGNPGYGTPGYGNYGYGNPGYGNGGYGNGGYYDNAPGNMDPREVARRGERSGYSAGLERGAYDAVRGHAPNPTAQGGYQSALNGWHRDWGSAGTYQQAYREAFAAGYEEGYRRSRGRF